MRTATVRFVMTIVVFVLMLVVAVAMVVVICVYRILVVQMDEFRKIRAVPNDAEDADG